jgi:hypothetical protein
MKTAQYPYGYISILCPALCSCQVLEHREDGIIPEIAVLSWAWWFILVIPAKWDFRGSRSEADLK